MLFGRPSSTVHSFCLNPTVVSAAAAARATYDAAKAAYAAAEAQVVAEAEFMARQDQFGYGLRVEKQRIVRLEENGPVIAPDAAGVARAPKPARHRRQLQLRKFAPWSC